MDAIKSYLVAHPLVASFASNLAWDLLKVAIFSLPIWIMLRWSFGLLKTLGQNVVFWLTVPLILTIGALFWIESSTPVIGSVPHLFGSIDAVQVFESNQCVTAMPYPNADPDDVYILVAASIKNSGSPSIADNWDFKINLATKGLVSPEGLAIGGRKFAMVDAHTGQTLTYDGDDALYEKTFDNPVGQGSVVRGILLYRVKGVAPTDFSRAGTEYKLTFHDILGNVQIIDWKWPETSLPLGYLPGLLNPAFPKGLTLPSASPTPSTLVLPHGAS